MTDNNDKYANLHIRTCVLQPVEDGPCDSIESFDPPSPHDMSPPLPKKARLDADDADEEPICTNLRACIAKWGLKPPYLRSEDQDYWASYYTERAILEYRHPSLRPHRA